MEGEEKVKGMYEFFVYSGYLLLPSALLSLHLVLSKTYEG